MTIHMLPREAVEPRTIASFNMRNIAAYIYHKNDRYPIYQIERFAQRARLVVYTRNQEHPDKYNIKVVQRGRYVIYSLIDPKLPATVPECEVPNDAIQEEEVPHTESMASFLESQEPSYPATTLPTPSSTPEPQYPGTTAFHLHLRGYL